MALDLRAEQDAFEAGGVVDLVVVNRLFAIDFDVKNAVWSCPVAGQREGLRDVCPLSSRHTE